MKRGKMMITKVMSDNDETENYKREWEERTGWERKLLILKKIS